MFRLMRDIRSEVPSHDTVPRGIVLFIELLLNEGSDVLFDVVLVQRLNRRVNGIVLHLL